MELAILAGLGALGWSFSAKGAATPPLDHTPRLLSHKNEFPFENQTECKTLLETDAQRARDHVTRVYDPHTGKYVFSPQSMPGASDKTAHVQNQRRMEMFTGAEETWNHKCETTSIFKPAELKVAVNSGGAARSADMLYDSKELIDRNVFGTKMNNVLPFEQTRVGPGVGVDISTPSSDGLHSQFRVLPTNALNAYRTNQLPTPLAASGSVQSGVTGGGRRYDTFVQSKPSLVTVCAPNLGPVTLPTNAQSLHPEVIRKPVRSEGTSCEFKGPAAAVAATGGSQTARTCEGHVQRELLPATPWLQSQSTILAPTEKYIDFVKNRKGTKRDTSIGWVTGRSGSRYSNYVDLGYDDTLQKKQLSGVCTSGGGHVTTRAGTKDGCWSLKTTTREQCADMVGGKYLVNSGDVRVSEPGGSGLRDMTAPTSCAASYLQKPSRNDSTVLMGKGRETQGRSTTGALRGGVASDAAQHGIVKTRIEKVMYHKQPSGFAPHALQRADPGRAKSCKKIPSANPRELGLGL
jgi:hypothetical protein